MGIKEIVEMILDKYPSLMIISVVIMLLSKFNPITTLTSLQLERKFYSKEKKFIQTIILYSIFSLHISIIIIILAYLMVTLNLRFNKIIYDILSTIGSVSYILIFWDKNFTITKESYIKKFKDFISNKQKFVDYLLIYWTAVISWYTSQRLSLNGLSKEKIGTTALGVLIFSIIITIMLVTVDWWKKADKIFSIIIAKEKWYLLHKTDKDEFLLGDCNNPSNCKKYMRVKSEELLNKDICVEETR